MDLDDYLALPRVSSAARAPDGTWLAVSAQRLDADGGKFVSDIWRVPTDGSAPVRLTDGDFSDRAPCFRDDGALGFLSDRPEEGDKAEDRSQVWRWQPAGLSVMTDEPLGVSSFAFAGTRLVLLTSLRPGLPLDEQRAAAEDRKKNGPSALHYKTLSTRHWDHWIGDAQPHLIVHDAAGRRDLTPAPGDHLRRTSLAVADGVAVVVAQALGEGSIPDGWLWAFDLQTGERTELGRAARTSLSGPVLSADGRTILCHRGVRVEGSFGESSLWRLDRVSGEGEAVAPGWDCLPTAAGLSADGTVAYATRRERMSTRLYRIDLQTGARTPLTARGCVGGVSVDGEAVGLWHDLRSPPQPFVLRDGARRMLPLYSAPELGVTVEELSVSSTDGAEVHGRIVRPSGAGPFSVLFMVHGGPISDWSDGWHWRWNAAYLASRGYVVALPNPRGSMGYGRDFVEGIWGNTWGGQCYQDLLAYADAVAARPDTDASRIAAMGGSFGGYMMNWFGVQTDRFRCLISHASISELASFQGVTDHPGWWVHQQGMSAHDEPEAQGLYSPLRYVRRWRTPVLIIHGEKDYRCTIDQGLQLFSALRMQGTEAELLVFPDEGHWIQKPRNVVAWYGAVERYLGEQLGG